jgi:preprotein translocase SecE subunit
MARDRKRAKQRQRRRSAERQPARVAARRAELEVTERERSEAERSEAGPLEHSSAEVDLAEAALAVPPEADLGADEMPQDDELGPGDKHAEDELQEPGDAVLAGERSPRRGRGGDGASPRRAGRGRAPGSELPGEGNRLANFLRASAAELRRVQWPDRRQVTQATGVVLGFVVIAGAYLGLLDAVFSRLVALII